MPKRRSYAVPMDKLLQELVSTGTGSYYEYYNKDKTISYDSHKGGTPDGKTTKAVHLHLDNPSALDSDYMLMFYTVLLHGTPPTTWKISSEGPLSPNPAKALVFDNMARAVADEKNWKYIAFGIAATEKSDPYYSIMNNFVVAIETYDCGQKSVRSLDSYIGQFIAAGQPEFWRFSCDGLSMAFVKKTKVPEYLQLFDNRPFQQYVSSAVKYISIDEDGTTTDGDKNWPYNWLISGAPGTGKSFFLDKECEKLVFGKTVSECVEEAVAKDLSTTDSEIKSATYKKQFEDEKKKYITRVTFFEDYIYDSFVGCYKPIVLDRDVAEFEFDTKTGSKTESKVSYEFVPGPFIDMYIKAKNDPAHNYCLVIEELNRAKAASVFGDMFQLLDREAGKSVYYVTPSKELKQYLEEHLVDATYSDEIRIPDNLFIWATMNSADRGVFPIDSAFKRRWVFKCQNVYAPRTDNGLISFFWKGTRITVLFDYFRNLINEKIGDDEDKYIGPWYFSGSELKSIYTYHDNILKGIECDCSTNPLVSKLLLYLRQDIFRHNPDEIFYDGNTVSKILNAYGKSYGIDEILKIDDDEIDKLVKDTEDLLTSSTSASTSSAAITGADAVAASTDAAVSSIETSDSVNSPEAQETSETDEKDSTTEDTDKLEESTETEGNTNQE